MSAQKAKLDALTSLRFFAAAMIVVEHIDRHFGSPGSADNFALKQGVSFFFVLSGFILAYNYPQLPTWQAKRAFWLARFARIWPAHFTTFLLVLALVPGAGPGHWRVPITVANLTLTQAWVPMRDFFLSYNGVSWSISDECLFYLAFPLLIYRWAETWRWKLGLTVVLVVVLILAGNWFRLPAGEDYQGVGLLGLLYMNPLARLFEFGLGIGTCALFRSAKAPPAGFGLAGHSMLEALTLAGAIFAMWAIPAFSYAAPFRDRLGEATAFWLVGAGSAPFFAALILVFARQHGMLSRLLMNPAMVLLGEISFSIYLVHTIVLRYYEAHIRAFPIAAHFMIGAVYWAVVLALSYLIYAAIEKPARALIVGLPDRVRGKDMPTRTRYDPSWQLPALLVGVAFAAFWQPSEVRTVNADQVEQFVRTANHADALGKALFGNGVTLLASDLRRQADGNLHLRLLWRAEDDVKLDYSVGVHAIDSAHQIIGQADYVEDPGRAKIKRGQMWLDDVTISDSRAPAASGVAIALYGNPQGPVSVTGGDTDWDGKRSLIWLH